MYLYSFSCVNRSTYLTVTLVVSNVGHTNTHTTFFTYGLNSSEIILYIISYLGSRGLLYLPHKRYPLRDATCLYSVCGRYGSWSPPTVTVSQTSHIFLLSDLHHDGLVPDFPTDLNRSTGPIP